MLDEDPQVLGVILLVECDPGGAAKMCSEFRDIEDVAVLPPLVVAASETLDGVSNQVPKNHAANLPRELVEKLKGRGWFFAHLGSCKSEDATCQVLDQHLEIYFFACEVNEHQVPNTISDNTSSEIPARVDRESLARVRRMRQ